jgi:hypothetical protein
MPDTIQRSASPEALPLRFPSGDWPWYAQGEIYLDPEPAMPGSPVEICVKVVNDDPTFSHTATLQFGTAPLGICVPYNPIGNVEFSVPASGIAMGCTMWVSPERSDTSQQQHGGRSTRDHPLPNIAPGCDRSYTTGGSR